MKIVTADELLRRAEAHLWDGKGDEPPILIGSKTEFICIALDRVATEDEDTLSHAMQAEIQRRMGVYTFGAFLNRELFPDLWETRGEHGEYPKLPSPAVQAHRLAWMRMLQKEWKGLTRNSFIARFGD